jgi:hypothetical protein
VQNKIPRFVNEWADFWQPEVNAIAVPVEGCFVLWPLLFRGFSTSEVLPFTCKALSNGTPTKYPTE